MKKIITLIILISLPLLAQDITNKLGGNTAAVKYNVTDSGNSELFRVQGDGNVGIGETNPIYKLHVVQNGTAHAGSFFIDNASSSNNAIFAETNGIGSAGKFQIVNSSNSYAAIFGKTIGSGGAGRFQIDNTSNSKVGLYTFTNGSGLAFVGKTYGLGSAGSFQIDNIANTEPVLFVNGNGSGPSIETNGSIKMVDGTEGAGKVLTSDANGVGSWQTASGGSDSDWSGAGTGSMYATNLTDKVGIGTSTPEANLDVHGTVKAFGTWDNSPSFGSVYEATTDGFVVVYGFTVSAPGDNFIQLKGLTDSSNPPSTLIAYDIGRATDNSTGAGITMPVKKGDFWKVELLGTPLLSDISWIPLGQ